MKTHHQNTWQFAKLILAALVFALGMVACGGGGGGSSSVTISPAKKGSQLAIASISVEAAAPVESSGAGTLSARSAFVITADAVNLRLLITVENKGDTKSAPTSIVVRRSDGEATLQTTGAPIRTYSVAAIEPKSEMLISPVITMTATLSADSTKPTRFIVEGQFAGETDAAGVDAVSNDYLGVEVYTDADGSVNDDDLITGTEIVDIINYDWSATGATASKTSSVATGERITLTIDVTNTIASRAPKASLSFYRSGDSTITINDTPVDVAPVSILALAAGATSKVSTDVFAPSSTGTYYYGACVVSDDDSDSSNDCSTSVEVAVTVATKYGALAFGEDADGFWYSSTSVDQPTQAAAHSEAIRVCESDSNLYTYTCAVLVTFTAHIAYAGGTRTNGADGVLAWATRNTLPAAETAAVAQCRSAGGKTSGEGACALIDTYIDRAPNSHSNSPAIAGAEAQGYEPLAYVESWDLQVYLNVSDSTLTPRQSFTLFADVVNWGYSELATPLPRILLMPAAHAPTALMVYWHGRHAILCQPRKLRRSRNAEVQAEKLQAKVLVH